MSFKTASLVSIITPSYNSQEYIDKTIESIQAQSYTNWELVITDDSSTDNTVDIVKYFQEEDSRIKLFVLDKNQGAGVARNNSIKKATGRYIAFCDSDDIWKPNKLQIQLKFMIENKIQFTYSSYEVIDNQNNLIKLVKVPHIITYKSMLIYNNVGCLTAMYDSKTLGKIYMPIMRKRQDYALWLIILSKIPFAKGLNESLACYRIREESISRNKYKLVYYNWLVYRKALKQSRMKSTILLLIFFLSLVLNQKKFKKSRNQKEYI